MDTLHELRGELGAHASIALLVGADSLVSLPTWKAWRSLFTLAHFVVAERPGSPLDGALASELGIELRDRWVDRPAVLAATPAGRIYRLHQPLQPESASDLRQRIAAGQPWRDLLPAAVAAYIADERLYFTTGRPDAWV